MYHIVINKESQNMKRYAITIVEVGIVNQVEITVTDVGFEEGSPASLGKYYMTEAFLNKLEKNHGVLPKEIHSTVVAANTLAQEHGESMLGVYSEVVI